MIVSYSHTVGRPLRRQGTVIAMLALSMVCLIGFLALAIDIGMLCVAKTQTQHAADLAALTAARTLNGNKANSYNNALATTNSQNIMTYNYILGQAVQPTHQLVVTYGSYDYNQTTQLFNANYPPTANVPWTATTATVTTTSLPGAFSTVFGSQFLPNLSATAQAVHRPRDIALVMDLSGSMRFGTCLGYDFYTNTRVSNNPDTLVPTFSHYSSASAGMVASSSTRTSAYDNYSLPGANTTATNSSYSLTYINSFYSSNAYASTLIRAFDSYTSTDGGTTWSAPGSGASPQLPAASLHYEKTPGGDVPLFKNGSSTTYAQNVSDVVGTFTARPNSAPGCAQWELDGYSSCVNGAFTTTDIGQPNYSTRPFYGYTKGPGYYGKTFFIWPPDPRRANLSTSGVSWTLSGGTSGGADTAQINQFLWDFGYTSNDFNNGTAVNTTLNVSGGINSSVTSLKVSSASGFPSTPFLIVIDSELINVTAVSGTTWTIVRGRDGTTAASHSNGATVKLGTGPALYAIYCAITTPGGSIWENWPAGDTALGTVSGTLSYYLVNNVYIPGGTRRLQTSDAQFQKIMRLYNWKYVLGSGIHCDWRLRFFGTDDNTVIFNSSGALNPPGTTGMCTATQTYNAILSWLATSMDPFPTQLRAGRIKYYGSIPTSITGTWPNYGSTDQRFWVEMIDHFLGYRQTAAGSYTDVSAMAGYGSDFTWGTVGRTAPPGAPAEYMIYTDNPLRPKLRHWFSPILMVDYMHNYNMDLNISNNYFMMQPGDGYEAPLYTGKEAYLAAIDTMQNNHPNDWFTLVPYSWPRTSATDSDNTHRLNCVMAPMGTNYSYAKSALVFPFSTINADGSCNNTEVTPFDADPSTGLVPSANFVDVGRANGDTCFAMALMLAYNQFAVTQVSDTTLRGYVTSTPITFPTAMAGGMGRKGSQKVIIFETDGLANTSATASLVTNGSYKYYQIRYDMNKPGSSEYPSVTASTINDSTVLAQVYSLVDQLATDYGSTRNPFRLYALGFGPVFQGTDASSGLLTLQTMQYHAGTQSSISTPLPSMQIITGTDTQMSANMVNAFTNILQSGVQIALIK